MCVSTTRKGDLMGLSDHQFKCKATASTLSAMSLLDAYFLVVMLGHLSPPRSV
jgi:hypothetical protein